MTSEIQKVGVIGTGTMGLGIAQTVAQAGISVVAVKATPGTTERARNSLQRTLGKLVEREKMTVEARDAILGRIAFSHDLDDVAECDLIIENIVEDLPVKQDMFKRLEANASQTAILTTNTSTLSVTALMSVCQHRSRIAGLHFFNPATVMTLVEIVHAFETSDATLALLRDFCKTIGKDPVIVQDTTGFIVNRLLTPYMLNAVRMLEVGTGTIEDIDHAMMAGASHPMGPFALADYIGLDVVNAMATNIYDDVRQQYCAPPHTLTRLVQLGYLGRKSGKGFYDYSSKPAVPNPALARPVA